MTPDQLPPGVRVKALSGSAQKEFQTKFESRNYTVGAIHLMMGRWHFFVGQPIAAYPVRVSFRSQSRLPTPPRRTGVLQLEIVNG